VGAISAFAEPGELLNHRTWVVRVLSQAPAYGFTVVQARTLLLRLKAARTSLLKFIPDENIPGSYLIPR
jgi:hypothetical protein